MANRFINGRPKTHRYRVEVLLQSEQGAKYKYNTVLIRMKFSTIGLVYTTKC